MKKDSPEPPEAVQTLPVRRACHCRKPIVHLFQHCCSYVKILWIWPACR